MNSNLDLQRNTVGMNASFSRYVAMALILAMAAQIISLPVLAGTLDDQLPAPTLKLKAYIRQFDEANQLPNSPQSNFDLRDQNAQLTAAVNAKKGLPIRLDARIDRVLKDGILPLSTILPTLVPGTIAEGSPEMESRLSRKLDVQQALELVLRQNVQVGIAQKGISVARWNYTGALGNFLPTVTLDAAAGGARKFTTGFPRLPLDSNNAAFAATVNYPLFQGGKVLFGAISSRESYLASQGQFAQVRNDALNAAATNYFNVLLNQAILNIRLDSAFYSEKQVSAYQQLFIKQISKATEALNPALAETSESALSSHRSQQYVVRLKKELASLGSALASNRADLGSAALPSRQAILASLGSLDRSALQLQAQETASEFLLGMLRIVKANDESVKSQITPPKLPVRGPLGPGITERTVRQPDAEDLQAAYLMKDSLESGTSALALNSADAATAASTRIEQLRKSLSNWRKNLTFAAAISKHALDLTRDAAEALSSPQTLETIIKQQSNFVEDHAGNSYKTILSHVDVVDSEVQSIQSKIHWPLEPSEKDKIIERIQALDNEGATAPNFFTLKNELGETSSLQLRLTEALAKKSNQSAARDKALESLSIALDQQNRASQAWNYVQNDLSKIVDAWDSRLEKSDDAAGFLDKLIAQSGSLRSLVDSDSVAMMRLTDQIVDTADKLQVLSISYPKVIRTQEVSDLRNVARLLSDEVGVRQSSLDKQIDSITVARDAQRLAAGFSFKIDQWQGQLGNDLQDLITQYIALRNSSIALAVLLNIDPRVDLLSRETYLALTARDLSCLPFVDLARQALNNRPELFTADEQRRAALANVAVASAALMPTFNISAQVLNAGVNHNFDGIHSARSYAFGGDLNYRFSNLLMPSFSDVMSRGAVAVQSYLQFRNQLNLVMQQLHQSYVNVQSARLQVAAALQAAQKYTKQISEADTPQKRVQVNASNLDVIQALQNRNANMIKLATNIANYNIAQAQLLHDIGQIYPVSNYVVHNAEP